MICEYCNQREAEAVLKQKLNGKIQIIHLCSVCANSMLLNNFFSDFSVNNIFAKNLETMPKTKKICSKCGASFEDIVSSGRIGCSYCYDEFANEINRTIEKVHGKAVHIGKKPRSAKKISERKQLIAEYRNKLNKLVIEQEFEEAALLRDKIKMLESEGM